LADASRNAQLADGTRFEAIVAGVSGYSGRASGRAPQLPARRFLLMHDAPVAHAGALSGRTGVVVIAGTGSVVYTRDREDVGHTLGGWGFLFGDEGSSFHIAREALALLMRAHDDGDAAFLEATHAACAFFGKTSLRQLARGFYAGELTRDRLAAFAPAALRFECFRAIANRGADRLAELARRAIDAGGTPRVALAGGVFGDAAFRQRVRDGICATLPDAEIVEARYEPAAGALLLAYRELGIEVERLWQ
jgi:glucosamine kinase